MKSDQFSLQLDRAKVCEVFSYISCDFKMIKLIFAACMMVATPLLQSTFTMLASFYYCSRVERCGTGVERK